MESLVTIALPDLADAAARDRTLASLVRHTTEPHEVVLLVEAEASNAGPPALPPSVARRIVVPSPFSAPAALNRLLVTTTTPYLLLLESGCVVTAGWLARLLAPLADPSVGMSGPSTNRSWNEQQVGPPGSGSTESIAQIDAVASSLAHRYGARLRSLDTLHSLGDFCYLFKRTVAEQLGGFDEAYGEGPCWEIDFSTRAARAGFRAVWVLGAYVHRAPPTPRRTATEQRLFSTSKHLYQDRFCGLRLRGQKVAYESHCRGEACPYFAPPDLVQVRLPSRTPVASPAEHAGSREAAARISAPESELVGTPAASESDTLPLVSCIMPTGGRGAFVLQSIRYFQRQDYPNRELIVVDDGTDDLAEQLAKEPRIRYVRVPAGQSIGAKRNHACQVARGSIIAHWDDDDWYASDRLSVQVAPLLSRVADITGLTAGIFFDLATWEFWTCTPELHRRLFTHDVHGGTLVYRRQIWEQLARYPAVSLAEDAAFLRQAVSRGARLRKLENAGRFIYLRHGRNAWALVCGRYLDARGWLRVPEPALPPADRAFYVAQSPAAPARSDSHSGSEMKSSPDSGACAADQAVPTFSMNAGCSLAREDRPLVTCIMPTADRRPFVQQAIQYFLRQDYPHRELVVVDDGADAIADMLPADPRLRYIRLDRRQTIGAKRNYACDAARGEIVVHWDDDDWSADWRLSYQTSQLLAAKADICGLAKLLYYDLGTGQTWQYVYPRGGRPWVAGCSLAYTRVFWSRNRFPDVSLGEDTRFVWSNLQARTIALPNSAFMVAMIHSANTSPKRTRDAWWHPYPKEEVERLLGADAKFYRPDVRSAPLERGAVTFDRRAIDPHVVPPSTGGRSFPLR